MKIYYKVIDSLIVDGPLYLPDDIKLLSEYELIQIGYFEIIEEPQPEFNFYTQNCNVVKNISNGKVYINFVVSQKIEEDLAINLSLRKKYLKECVTEIRYNNETSGLSINGTTIKTDRESQATTVGALSYLNLAPHEAIDWKAQVGWTVITQQSAILSSLVIGKFVQNNFSREKYFHELIDAANTHADLDLIDINEGWPSNSIIIGA